MIPRQRGAVRAVLNGAIFGALLGPIAAHAADKWRYGVVEAKGDAGLIFMPSRFGDNGFCHEKTHTPRILRHCLRHCSWNANRASLAASCCDDLRAEASVCRVFGA